MKMLDTEIKIKKTNKGDIVIRIPGDYLRHHISMSEDFDEGSRITNINLFAEAVLKELERELDDGTTPVHTMLDIVVLDAVDNGADGIFLGDAE